MKDLLWMGTVTHNIYSGTNSKNLWGMLLSYLEAFEFSAELYRRSYRRCSKTKGVLNIFAKLTGVISKVAFLTPTTLLKERLWYMCFPVNFAKLLRTPILENICKRLIYLFIYLLLYLFIYLFIYLFFICSWQSAETIVLIIKYTDIFIKIC